MTQALTGQHRIVFAIDGSYVQPLSVVLVSLWEAHRASRSRPNIVVLHEHLGARAQTVIDQLARTIGLRVDLLEVPSATSQRQVSGWWSRAMYLRFAIPELLSADRVALCLDADTLILESLAATGDRRHERMPGGGPGSI